MLRSLYGQSRGAISPVLQPRRDLLACLQTLGQMPRAQKRSQVLYIPKPNRVYWGDLRQEFPGEGSVSFIAPAFTGIAMIYGEPEFEDMNDTRRLDYGFWSYAMPTQPAPPSSIDAAKLAARAKALGFRQLTVIDDASCDVRTIQLE
jgi:hypothetical protein